MSLDLTIEWRPALPLWNACREKTLNWLALGMLLAAWSVADNGVVPDERGKPEKLRGYATVSVRALQRAATPSRS